MAEEELIIIEDEEASSSSKEQENEQDLKAKEEEQKKKKKLIIIGSISAVATILIITIALIFIFKSKKEPIKDINTTEITEKTKNDKPKLKVTELEELIKKANILYNQGNKKEALKLYEQIALYSESISNYNLGVAQIKEKAYDKALESFKKSIENSENRCVSALNAAVCSLYLGKDNLFQYYIDLSWAFLQDEANSPLYSYYYALINYYKNQYFETLIPLNNPTSDFFLETQNHIKSKIYALFGDDLKAIDTLEKSLYSDDELYLGMLYARVGEYDLAYNHIQKAIANGYELQKSEMSLALILLKRGDITQASNYLDKLYQADENISEMYPIKVSLKDTLFDIHLAQQNFKRDLMDNKRKLYSLFFYYAPYMVFNADSTISYIRKGTVNIFLNETKSALNILDRSSTLSNVNLSIAKGIKLALDFRIKDANELFKSLIDKFQTHSILHYNLALTYAQMGDIVNAQKHFQRSYHLDPKNYQAAIFTMMCAELLEMEYKKIYESVLEDLEELEDDKNIDTIFYKSQIDLIKGNNTSVVRWLETKKDDRPIYLLLDIVISQKIGNEAELKDKSNRLKELLPKDLISNILFLYSQYANLDIKDFSKKVQQHIKSHELDLNAIYYGPDIARDMYVKLNYISGILIHLKDRLKDRLLVEKIDTRGVLKSLALSNIYLNEFEEAFAQYNKMIDDMKIKDTNTLFLASVAAIGANHHENAIALLELAKLTDKSNLDARLALGLLYQQVKNFKGANFQYKMFKDKKFISEYFDFDIDLENRLN
ncbi:MAG: tetratricopeptide repeat protein [Campylobacterales bacterium]|nr:tetratricopeptide repeat protein [Campylobacterales bacterium]